MEKVCMPLFHIQLRADLIPLLPRDVFIFYLVIYNVIMGPSQMSK